MSSESLAPNSSLKRPVIPDVLCEHFEEVGFLSLQRRRLIFSTEFPLRRLPAHDERIAAHWDGLVIGSDASADLAKEKLAGADPWDLATAVRVWIEIGEAEPAAVADRLALIEPEQVPSWKEAFRQLSADRVAVVLPARTLSNLPASAFAVAVDAHAWHRRLPADVAELAATHADPVVRGAFARGAAHSGLGDGAANLIHPLLRDPDLSVRRHSLWAAALLMPSLALEHCRRDLFLPEPDPFAVRVLGLLGEPSDHDAFVEAAATDTGRLAAFWAFADLGTAQATGSLTLLMTLPDDELCSLAGECLEWTLGTIPRKDSNKPPTLEEAQQHLETVLGRLGPGARVLGGQARPWLGDPAEEPMQWLWRSAIAGEATAAPWLRREVPDGFFEGLPAGAARPGE